jgi:DNA-binding phage protein
MVIQSNINRKNLRRFCHIAGFAGITGLSRSIGISRNTIYEAVGKPNKYPRAYPRIIKALNVQN